MSTLKLSTGEYPSETYAMEDVIKTAYAAYRGIAEAAGGAGSPLDSGMATQGLYALVAAILEIIPGVATNRDLRVISEHVGDQIHDYLKLFRKTYEDHGVHAIEQFGASTHRPETLARQ